MGFLIKKIPLLHKIPIGGRLSKCLKSWKLISQSSWVCSVIGEGYKIPFKYLPIQRKAPSNPPASGPALDILTQEAEGLELKRAIVPVEPCTDQFISSYFAVPKLRSPGKFRPILNLKKLNKNIKKYKFRMEGLAQIRDWIQPNSWLCTMDLKDQFLHVKINSRFHKFLRFAWLGKLFQWTVLPFGLKCSPRVVTKILKPVMAYLRTTFGILISIYIDDMLLQASSPELVYENAKIAALVLMAFGWSLNWEKSSFIPSQEVKHLGFLINTQSMTIRCPADKVERLQSHCKTVLSSGCLTVHECEKLLGTMESVRPATKLAALHYRPLQRQLLHAKVGFRDPGKVIFLSPKSKHALKWWVCRSGFESNCSAPIREPEPTLSIWTDSNMEMGGGCDSRGGFVQRKWNVSDLKDDPHISVLEAKAAKEAVMALAKPGDLVRLHIDNNAALAYVKKQGGTRSYSLNKEACKLWEFASLNNVKILTPQWIGSKENYMADFLSRNSLDFWDFRLNRQLFKLVVEHFQVFPSLDAFATAQTAQLPRYMSWHEDPGAVGRNALLLPWDQTTYLFPPTPLLPKVIQKVKDQEIKAILVCPNWPSALWWPLLLELMVEPPFPLPHYGQALETLLREQPLPYLDPLVALHLQG